MAACSHVNGAIFLVGSPDVNLLCRSLASCLGCSFKVLCTCFRIYQVPPPRISHICEDIVRYCVKICDQLEKKKIVIVCSAAYVTRFFGFTFPGVALTGMMVCLM